MTQPKVGLIWAESDGGIIGSDGVMPWHLPEDQAHFKAVTTGSPVLMGRKTWESLPARFRPLPGRRNIVVTRNPQWGAEGAEVAHSLDAALELAAASDTEVDATIWVIGGAQLYSSAMNRADTLEVTEIRAQFDGDTTAPVIGEEWQQVGVDPDAGWHTSAAGLHYRFLRYARR